MLTRKLLVSALVAAGALTAVAVPLPSMAAGPINLHTIATIYNAPAYETVQVNHRGHNVWVPGHWQWSSYRHRYVWVEGHYAHRPGYHGPRWDRDGDGIANRYDPTPDGGVRYGYRDRDGDGVPNRYDSYPNNPYYR